MTRTHTLCPTHRIPLISFQDKRACPVELAEQHLLGKLIVDFVPTDERHPVMLVFADGHTLPILCAHCGRWLRLDTTEDDFLDIVCGRWVSGVQCIPIEDAEPGMPNAICLTLDAKHLPSMHLPLHPDSIAQMLVSIPKEIE